MTSFLSAALAAGETDLCCLFEAETAHSSDASHSDASYGAEAPDCECPEAGTDCSSCGLTHAATLPVHEQHSPLFIGQTREALPFSALPPPTPDRLIEPPIA